MSASCSIVFGFLLFSLSRKEGSTVLQYLLIRFRSSLIAEIKSKPDPTMIRLALEQTGCTPEETLMVGDRLYTDIACGVNAGVDTALVLTGEATAQDAAKSETPPTLVCRDLGELLVWLREAGNEVAQEAKTREHKEGSD